MPTYQATARFWRDWAKLAAAQKADFLKARDDFLEDLRTGPHEFRPQLRVKPVKGAAGIWEMTWAYDGRALWQYGTSPIRDHVHINWLQIGTHDVFRPF